MYKHYGTVEQFIKRLDDEYGADWYDWLPETLLVQIKEDFNMVMDPVEENKLFAARLVLTSDQPYKDPFIFENTILALADIVPIMDSGQIITLVPFIRSVKKMLRLKNEAFSPEVLKYIAALFYVNNAFYIPKGMGEVSDAGPYLMRLMKDRGEIDIYERAEKTFEESRDRDDDSYKLYKLYKEWRS